MSFVLSFFSFASVAFMQVSVTLFVPHSLHYCVPRSVMYSFQVAHRHSRVRLGGYSLLLFYVPLYSCMFFYTTYYCAFFFRFFSPYFIPNGLLFLYFFCISRCFQSSPTTLRSRKATRDSPWFQDGFHYSHLLQRF